MAASFHSTPAQWLDLVNLVKSVLLSRRSRIGQGLAVGCESTCHLISLGPASGVALFQQAIHLMAVTREDTVIEYVGLLKSPYGPLGT